MFNPALGLPPLVPFPLPLPPDYPLMRGDRLFTEPCHWLDHPPTAINQGQLTTTQINPLPEMSVFTSGVSYPRHCSCLCLEPRFVDTSSASRIANSYRSLLPPHYFMTSTPGTTFNTAELLSVVALGVPMPPSLMDRKESGLILQNEIPPGLSPWKTAVEEERIPLTPIRGCYPQVLPKVHHLPLPRLPFDWKSSSLNSDINFRSRGVVDGNTEWGFPPILPPLAGKRRCMRCRCPNCQNPNPDRPKGSLRKHICHFPGCHKVYGKTSHLRAHLRWHVGDRPFRCRWIFCRKCFTRSDELQRHLKTHTGDKKFLCRLCCKRFMRSDHLKKHLKTHQIKDSLAAAEATGRANKGSRKEADMTS